MMGGSIYDAPGSSSQHPPSSRCDAAPVPAIFLSHSGKQKPFVENLYDALRRVNHTAFFDQHTLLKGARFPPEIESAARGCELGVVVLSEDFITSKWPMLELEILVRQRGPEAKVLPLFYKLRPEDLKSPENLSRWREVWEENAGTPDAAVEWGEALRALKAFNGEIFVQGRMSEASYINRVVHSICKEVPSPLPYDLSPIKGVHRLAKEVAGTFDRANNSRQCEEACMVGLHGVGGLGKTSICKIMANFYSLEYPGRSHHLELPTDGNDMPQIVQGCKKALKELTNLSDELVLNRADHFDQVIQLMRERLSQYDVFLAIDNVWEASWEAAKRILGAGFSANSKILLTSRSEQVLKDVLEGHNKACVGPLPAPVYEEAVQIFQDALGSGWSDLNSLGNRDQVDRVLKRFLFDDTYHALALKALGRHVKKGCRPGDAQKNEDFLSRLLEQIRNEDLHMLQDVIRLSYENLPEQRKHIFLDVALWRFMAIMEGDAYGNLTEAEAHRCLSFLYKDQFSEITITILISELSLDGLVQLDTDFCGERVIRVHDLYSDLALREAATSSRFFIMGRSNKPVEEIEWDKLARLVMICRNVEMGNDARFVEELQWQKCRKLQVLHAEGVNLLEGIDICRTPSLRALHLKNVTLRSIKNWSAASGLVSVFLDHVIDQCTTVLNLNGLVHLQLLHIKLESCHALNGLDTLANLQSLFVIMCERLEKLPDLSRLTRLEELYLSVNASLEEVGGFSPTLKTVKILECKALKKLPDLNRLTRLEELRLYHNRSLEEVGCFSPCEALKIPEEVGGFSPCKALKKVPELRRLNRLVGGFDSPTLKMVHIWGCYALKKLPDLSRLTCLEELVFCENASLEEVGGLSPTLKTVEISICKALKKLPDLSRLTRLEELHLYHNTSLEEVGGFSPTLKTVKIEGCIALKKLPDLSRLTRFNTSLKEDRYRVLRSVEMYDGIHHSIFY